MSAHNARAIRETGPGGVGRGWKSACTCGHNLPQPTREHAEAFAQMHEALYNGIDLASSMRCECYDIDSMEHAPEPCLRCRLVATLTAPFGREAA